MIWTSVLLSQYVLQENPLEALQDFPDYGLEKKGHFWRLVVSVKAYQIIKTFLLFFSFWRMEEVSVIQYSCWVYNLLPLLIFEERFIASCGNTEYSKGTHWLLDPCLPSIFINTLLSFLPKSDCCWLLPTLSYLEHYMIPDYFMLCSCSVCGNSFVLLKQLHPLLVLPTFWPTWRRICQHPWWCDGADYQIFRCLTCLTWHR